MKPPIISVIGKKKSGKTTLLEKLIPALKARNYRIGSVKHDTHGFDIDHEGKDSWRHKVAGAEAVLISSPWKLSLIKDTDSDRSLRELVSDYMSDMDLVLTEGYNKADMPKVEVFRSAAHKTPLNAKSANDRLFAVLSDTPMELGVPNFDIDDIDSLADLIEAKFLK
jgi:molybdopterin-guanine dinucleotide biosynthesis protein B